MSLHGWCWLARLGVDSDAEGPAASDLCARAQCILELCCLASILLCRGSLPLYLVKIGDIYLGECPVNDVCPTLGAFRGFTLGGG